jgi:hypothetical protein
MGGDMRNSVFLSNGGGFALALQAVVFSSAAAKQVIASGKEVENVDFLAEC